MTLKLKIQINCSAELIGLLLSPWMSMALFKKGGGNQHESWLDLTDLP